MVAVVFPLTAEDALTNIVVDERSGVNDEANKKDFKLFINEADKRRRQTRKA